MSLTELKEAVGTLSAEERHQLRDILDALEEGVTVAQLHEIDQMLDEAIESKEPSIPIEQVRAEMKTMLESLSQKSEKA